MGSRTMFSKSLPSLMTVRALQNSLNILSKSARNRNYRAGRAAPRLMASLAGTIRLYCVTPADAPGEPARLQPSGMSMDRNGRK